MLTEKWELGQRLRPPLRAQLLEASVPERAASEEAARETDTATDTAPLTELAMARRREGFAKQQQATLRAEMEAENLRLEKLRLCEEAKKLDKSGQGTGQGYARYSPDSCQRPTGAVPERGNSCLPTCGQRRESYGLAGLYATRPLPTC